MLRKINLILAITSAALLALSFPNYNFTLLAWVGLIPLLFAVQNASPIKAFALSYLAGVLFFLFTMYWLVHVTLPGMILVVLYLALYFGLFGLVTAYSVQRIAYSVLIFIPALWVSLEWVRSTGMFGLGWALLAHSQSYNLPVIQIADITGAYGVSFLVVLVNVAIFLFIKNFRRPDSYIVPLALATILIFAVLRYGYIRLNNIFTGEKIKIAIVQGNIPQFKKWDADFRDEILDKYEALTRAALKDDKADLVIWPETSVPGFLESEVDLMRKVRDLAKEIKTPLLVGTPREDSKIKDIYYNSATLLLDDGRIAAGYDKLHLVPFGEYIPFERTFSFINNFAPTPIGNFAAGASYTVFDFFVERKSKEKDGSWRLLKKVKFSCLICFEDIFPELSREFVRRGAQFLVNITNDAWFYKTSAPYQHAQSSVFRAVENRTNVVRAANTGLSCFIDQKGRITGSVKSKGEELFVDGFRTGEITLTSTRTIYSAYGDVFAYCCMALTVMFLTGFIFKAARRQRWIF